MLANIPRAADLEPGRVTRLSIPSGDRGTAATLRVMARLVRDSLTDPLTLYAARAIVRGVPESAALERAHEIRQYLGSRVAFALDPVNLELVWRPRAMLEDIAARGFAEGDCDDVAVLGAALGEAIGLPARFVVYGFASPFAPFTHVFTELLAGPAGWVDLDTTRPQQPTAGQTPLRVKTFNI